MSSALLVLGAGLMGPAAAYSAMRDPEVHAVDLADVSQAQLDAAWRLLERHPGADKLRAIRLDLADRVSAAWRVEACRVMVAAGPPAGLGHAIRAAADAGRSLVALTWPPSEFTSRGSTPSAPFRSRT